MGVKSTINLTREDAMRRLADLKADEFRKMIEAQLHTRTDTQIEDELEFVNDCSKGGEGFENYRIVPAD